DDAAVWHRPELCLQQKLRSADHLLDKVSPLLRVVDEFPFVIRGHGHHVPLHDTQGYQLQSQVEGVDVDRPFLAIAVAANGHFLVEYGATGSDHEEAELLVLLDFWRVKDELMGVGVETELCKVGSNKSRLRARRGIKLQSAPPLDAARAVHGC